MEEQADVYRIELTCQSKPFKKEKWQLELSSEQVGLRNGEGNHVLVEGPGDAAVRLTVPGFASENSNLGVNLDEMELAFKIAKPDLEVVRQYVDTVVAASDLQDLDRVRQVAIKQLTWGGVGLVACGVILAAMIAGGADEDSFKIFGMGAFWGLIFFGKGIAGLKRHKRLVAMRDEAVGS
ncbi:MAG: hypothetical protein QGH11_03605 [Pirellulaceae bacterium]|nr:hypothetical protein [Pirellulaceae bacterium]